MPRGKGSLDRRVPRPGIEPGLEVPETSVMSFSLPGRAGVRQKQKLPQPRHPNKRFALAPGPVLQTDTADRG